jgi:hypothetical protein
MMRSSSPALALSLHSLLLPCLIVTLLDVASPLPPEAFAVDRVDLRDIFGQRDLRKVQQ